MGLPTFGGVQGCTIRGTFPDMTWEYNPTREKSICSRYLRLGSCYDAAPYGGYAPVGEQYAGPGFPMRVLAVRFL